MALNALDNQMTPEDIMRGATLANELAMQRAQAYRKMGGIDPATLQDLAAQWANGLNPGFNRVSFADLLAGVAVDAGKLDTDEAEPDEDERTLAAGLMVLLFQYAYTHGFNLLEVTDDGLDDLWNRFAGMGAGIQLGMSRE